MSGRKRKQLTLGSWKGFKKLVQHRGKKVEVDIPTVATVKYVTCDICKQEFVNNQGLGCHKLKCEKEHNITQVLSTSQTPLSVPKSSTSRYPNVFVERDVKMVLSRIVDRVVKSVDKVTNQQGASCRESHSATFEAKVLN